MAAPTYQAIGTAVSATTGTLTVAWPTHVAGDIGLLFIETAGGSAAPSLSTASGFVLLGTTQATGTSTAGTQLAVFWARATSAAMASPIAAGVADHQFGVIMTARGCTPVGNPFDVEGGGVKASASTSATLTSLTTTVADTLVVLGITSNVDATTAFVTSMTNASFTGISERHDAGTISGLGGAIGIYTATYVGPGSTGTTAAVVTSSINAFKVFALKSAPSDLDQYNDTGGTAIGFGQAAGTVYRAQGFIPTKNSLTKIGFKPNSVGTKGLKVIIDVAGSNSFPTGTLGTGLYSFTITNATLSTSFKEYSLPVALTVTTGSQYCFYLAPWDTGTNLYSDDYRDFDSNTANPYASGKMSSYASSAWTNNDAGTSDMVFATYGTTVAVNQTKFFLMFS